MTHDEIERLLSQATQGTLEARAYKRPSGSACSSVQHTSGRTLMVEPDGVYGAWPGPSGNAKLFAAAPKALRQLLDEVGALRQLLAWHEERHGTRDKQEAEEAADAALWAEGEAMTREEIVAELDEAGVDSADSLRTTQAIISSAVYVTRARQERDAAQGEVAELREVFQSLIDMGHVALSNAPDSKQAHLWMAIGSVATRALRIGEPKT